MILPSDPFRYTRNSQGQKQSRLTLLEFSFREARLAFLDTYIPMR